jgi:uncharacterized protein (TIGR03067 family)
MTGGRRAPAKREAAADAVLLKGAAMRMRTALALGACLLVSGVGRADDQGKKDDDAVRKDLAALEGTWVVAGKEFMGKKATKDEIDKIAAEFEMVIKDGKRTLNDVLFNKVVSEATLTLDPMAKPKAMDLVYTSGDQKGTTDKAIYEVEGDTLKVCYPFDSAERPTEFAGKPDGNALFMTYKRVKK